jgi:flagellar protein FliT
MNEEYGFQTNQNKVDIQVSTVQELLCLSEEFYEEMSKPYSNNERDSVIAKIKEFLAIREAHLKDLTGPFSAEDQRVGELILEYDAKIQDKLNDLNQSIKADLLTVKNQKRNTPKYINPYPSMYVNGVFYDKRK